MALQHVKNPRNAGRKPLANPTQARTMRFAESDWQEFERLAGGSGRALNKWILETLKNATINTV